MAGSTDPTTPVEKKAPKPSGGLWQAPVFVLGAGAIIAVCLARTFLAPEESATSADREIDQARHLLENPDDDGVRAAKLLENVLNEKDKYPDAAGEADLLLGTSLMRQAAKADGRGHRTYGLRRVGASKRRKRKKFPNATAHVCNTGWRLSVSTRGIKRRKSFAGSKTR